MAKQNIKKTTTKITIGTKKKDEKEAGKGPARCPYCGKFMRGGGK